MKHEFTSLSCGVDVSKDKFNVCIGGKTSDGRFIVRGQKKFDNTPGGIQQFLAWNEQQRVRVDAQKQLPFQVVMEATGVYHEHLCLSCYEAKLPVCVELAKKVKKYVQSLGAQTKTDKEDAKYICQMGSERKLTIWKPCSPNIMHIKLTIRHRKSLIKKQTQVSNQLHAMSYSTAESKSVLSSLQRMAKMLDKEITRMEKSIQTLYDKDETLKKKVAPIVSSIKGLGLLTVLTIIAETNGFAMVNSRKQLARYAGYDIVANESGNSSKPTRISKKGNARIRSQMYMAAMAFINTKQGPIYDFYTRIRERNPKHYKIANVAVQRKLLLLVFTLYKNNAAYDPRYEEKKLVEQQHLQAQVA